MEFSRSALMNALDGLIEAGYKNGRQLAYVICCLAVLVAAFLGYLQYDSSMQASAHKAFVEALKYHDAAVVPGSQTVVTGDAYQFGSDVEKWKAAEVVFADAASSYKGTRLGPVLRAYRADALVQLGNYEAALSELKSAVSSMASEEVKDFYKVKLALLKTDSPNAATAQEGFAELKHMAEQADHLAHEEALYYVGAYFWAHKDYAQARNYWQQLMVKYGLKESKQNAGFAELVRSKLKLISADW